MGKETNDPECKHPDFVKGIKKKMDEVKIRTWKIYRSKCRTQIVGIDDVTGVQGTTGKIC